MVTVWRAVSQLVMAMESEKAALSRCGERMRIFRCGSWWMILYASVLPDGPAARGAATSWRVYLVLVSDMHGASRCSAVDAILWDVIAALGPVGDQVVDDDVADAVGV